MKKVRAVRILSLAFALSAAAAFAQVVPVSIPFQTIYYCTYSGEFVVLEGVAAGTWDTSSADATVLTVSFEGVHGTGLLSGAPYRISGDVVQRIVPAVTRGTGPLEMRVPLTVCRGERTGSCLSWDITITPAGKEAGTTAVSICGHCHVNRES